MSHMTSRENPMEGLTTGTHRIHVDRTRCEGLGVCELQAPDYFEVQDDGTLAAREEVGPQDLDAVRGSVESCPTAALRLIRT